MLRCLGGFQDQLYYDPVFYVTCKFDRSLKKGVFHDSYKSTGAMKLKHQSGFARWNMQNRACQHVEPPGIFRKIMNKNNVSQ